VGPVVVVHAVPAQIILYVKKLLRFINVTARNRLLNREDKYDVGRCPSGDTERQAREGEEHVSTI
jgi:hypothetical protein